jgi:hypothetical protein
LQFDILGMRNVLFITLKIEIRMWKALKTRLHDVIASVYLYNEYTGYMELEKLIEALKVKYPAEVDFIQAVEKHCNDERKHYLMFRNYFKKRGYMPYKIDKTYGYVDLFIQHIFKKPIEDLNREEILHNDQLFFKLCRLIMMTEFRGMKQVDVLLKSRKIKDNPGLVKIFKVIERDEPWHCYPYQYWLQKWGKSLPRFQEKITDLWIHYSLVWVKIPLLVVNWRLKRMDDFYA